MKLGYIHAGREEQTRVLKVMKMLAEPTALDELGIGRIRDAFSGTMFPGVSTLQKHLKYFSLMPQLYKKAAEKRYNRPAEVKNEIVRLERIMTENLCRWSGGAPGITGSETIKRHTDEYVKYDPSYIYNSGLLTFGILRGEGLHRLIFSASRKLHEAPARLKTEDGETADDEAGGEGIFRFCDFPCVDYDFTDRNSVTSLELTPEDKEFITSHILASEACRGTLLRFIVANEDLELRSTFPGVDSSVLPPDIAHIQTCARRFADFIYLVNLRYNMVYSAHNSPDGKTEPDAAITEEFFSELDEYARSGTDINEVLGAVSTTEKSSIAFCIGAAGDLAEKSWDRLDRRIIAREKLVKGSRRKIDNPSYTYDPEQPVQHRRLSFRWETVSTFAAELGRRVVAEDTDGKEAARG